MQVGLSTLYDIGNNYSVRLNEKELLVYEKVESEKLKDPVKKQLEEAEEKKDKENSLQPNELSEDEKRLVKDLQARDREVKAHEAAHQAAGGGMTGAATFTYQQGPDGKMYAIGGEVSISTPAASTPEEAIANARQVVAAAMAPGNPSPQDFSVAASARVMEMKAQQQLAKEQQEEIIGKDTYNNLQASPIDNEDDDAKKFDISA